MAEADDVARAAVERLSEDESLRGGLTDEGFGSLFDWGVAALQAFAQTAKDPADLEPYADRVRKVIRSAVTAAEKGRIKDLHPLVDCIPVRSDYALRSLKGLRLGDDPDANARQIAAVLQAALRPAAPRPLLPRPPNPETKPS